MFNEQNHADWRQRALALEESIAKTVIGQRELIRLVSIALFARGHVLLEGDVGVGKTTLLRAFAQGVGGEFERVEGTIDLMPNDLIYHSYVDSEGRPGIDPGPLLRHREKLTTFFFNEINRARPQVQSLLLRAMAERSVSAFNREFEFPHMTVFADRNRLEKEETFELASAARDRFMFELSMATPADVEIRRRLIFDTAFHDTEALIGELQVGICEGEQLNEIGNEIQRFVQASPTIQKYLQELWQASETPQRFGINIEGVELERLILAGVSPRGMSALARAARVVAWLDGRDYLIPEDVHAVLPAALGHRIFFTPIYELRRTDIGPELITQMMNCVASP